jgi:hypothetical protein
MSDPIVGAMSDPDKGRHKTSYRLRLLRDGCADNCPVGGRDKPRHSRERPSRIPMKSVVSEHQPTLE